MFTNKIRLKENKQPIDRMNEIREHSCSFVADILFFKETSD